MYNVIINRTGKKEYYKTKDEKIVDDVLIKNGFGRVLVLDIKNYKDIKWEGIEFNRLFEKNGILYRFNNWTGEYPFPGVEVEEIGITNGNK